MHITNYHTLDSRLLVPLAELRQSVGATDATGFERVLKALVEARLIVVADDHDQQAPSVEVAHEALIRKWPTLRAWIDEDRAGLLIRRRLKQAVLEWEQHKCEGSRLYRGGQLVQANEWRKTWESRLGEAERRFLDASEEEEAALRRREREAAEKYRQLLLDQYVDRGHELLFEKKQLYPGALWLHRAYKEGSTNPALSYLLKSAMLSVEATRVLLTGHGSVVKSVSFSPKGQRIVTASNDNTARVWDTESGELLAELRGHLHLVNSARFNSDGRRIVTASNDNTARIWDAESG